MPPILIVILSQAFFSAGDLIARANIRVTGFHPRAFVSWWFLTYTLVRVVATFAQLYVFANLELGRSMALFGAVSIVLSNVLGLLLLGETLSLGAYLGVTLAIVAFLVLALIPG
jgi:multidrug transporter EmrE-like cation transporter